MAEEDVPWLDLPDKWTYGVLRDGRVFFINDQSKSTRWVHPRIEVSVQSGHCSSKDLPPGWEKDYTPEGALYFINHNERRNTFKHPVTEQVPEESQRFQLQKSAMSSKSAGARPVSLSSETSNYAMVSEACQDRPNGRPSRPSKKGIAFGKRSNSMKRNPNAKVTKSGWLYKQASSGVKKWNKRWFVLVDRCLFYYKDEKEEGILGSIPLLSFCIAAVQPTDNITRKFTFKVTVCRPGEALDSNENCISPQAEHAGIRTYIFSAEGAEEQESWIQAMSEASSMHSQLSHRNDAMDTENTPPSQDHHGFLAHRERQRADLEKQRGEGDGRGSEKIERRAERIESKKEAPPLKPNGLATPQEMPSEPGSPYPDAPRGSATGDRPLQPNGWQFQSPSRPGSTAYPPLEGDNLAHRRFVPRTNPEKMAQRQSSMTQLQQWVNLRRGAPPPEELQSPTRFFPGPPGVRDFYDPYSPQYPEEYQFFPPGVRPDSICSMPAFERVNAPWPMEEKRPAFRNGGPYHPRDWKDQAGYGRQQDGPVWMAGGGRQPMYYDEIDSTSDSLRRLSFQPRSRSVPRSPSQGTYNRPRLYSPVRSPSARFDRLPPRSEAIYADPAAYIMRRSVSSPKYDYVTDRRPPAAGMYPYNYPGSPNIHDKMDELLDLQLQRNLEYLDEQVSPYPDPYREALQGYKRNGDNTDKLLGKLCEQHKVVREQDRLVQQLRAEKESLESALMATHQELEMFGSQPAYPEKLLHKKESLQNQLINIRVELSQATTALSKSTLEYETLENEVCALHDDLWEQLNLDIQNEVLNGQIQKEIWRIQDVMEGLRKNNPSRGTDTAKHRVPCAPSGTYSSNSPASPLSSASLTSPLSPFSLISGSQGSPTKQSTNEELGPPRPPLPKAYAPLESPPSIPTPPRENLFRPWPPSSAPSWQHSGESKRGQPHLELQKKDFRQVSTTLVPVDMALSQHRQESEADTQPGVNKGTSGESSTRAACTLAMRFRVELGDATVGIVPPRTKLPSEEDSAGRSFVVRRGSSKGTNGHSSRERPKSAVFSNEMKAKMSVEEQIDRMKRHQSGSMKEKRRSLQLLTNQQGDGTGSKPAAAYRVVRRHRSIHEVDISDLEAALRSEEPSRAYETPREEIARLRKLDLEPQTYTVDINKELSTPDKVTIPERYIDLEPDTPLSPEEEKEKQKKVERIKTLIAKSSLQNVVPLTESEVDIPVDSESQLQEQEKRIEISCTLAAEASRRGRLLSALCATPSPPTSPVSLAPQLNPFSSEPSSRGVDSSSSNSSDGNSRHFMSA
ncbi:pleckstrin homology domain-containing family A member 6 isoform X2 [Ambystoma mexicanum]|uniref:pleckstrin homology domain-containing family A member 6 isoform X2 n=1 Tax=Ambystoma mexicanum TaxID=8296 RepID=UPI0037E920B3